MAVIPLSGKFDLSCIASTIPQSFFTECWAVLLLPLALSKLTVVSLNNAVTLCITSHVYSLSYTLGMLRQVVDGFVEWKYEWTFLRQFPSWPHPPKIRRPKMKLFEMAINVFTAKLEPKISVPVRFPLRFHLLSKLWDYEGTKERRNQGTKERTNERNERNEWTNERTSERTIERSNEQTNEGANARTHESTERNNFYLHDLFRVRFG